MSGRDVDTGRMELVTEGQRMCGDGCQRQTPRFEHTRKETESPHNTQTSRSCHELDCIYP